MPDDIERLRSADEIASLVEEIKAADARAWEALEKIPPAVLLDPRGSGAEREKRARTRSAR